MENTKAKNIVITILVILLLCCLGVIAWKYMQLNDNKESEVSTQDKVNTENKVEELKREDLDINSELVQKLHGYIPSQHYYSDNNLTAYQNKLVTMDNFENPYLLICAFHENNTNVNKIMKQENVDVTYYFKPENFQDDVKRIYGKELKNESFASWFVSCNLQNGLYDVVEGGGGGKSIDNLTEVYAAYKIENNLYIEEKYLLCEGQYDEDGENWISELYTSSERNNKIVKVIEKEEDYQKIINNNVQYIDKYVEGEGVVSIAQNLYPQKLFKQYENQSQKYKHTFKLSEEGTYYWYSTEPID